jgi:pyruvate dehydrogenase E2 component (dihydrolipoamide acetyltransferase)
MDRYKKKHGHKLSVTHVILKAVALAYRKFPDLNVKVERNHLYRRNSIDVNLLVSSESGGELSAIKLNNADKMTLAEIVGQVKKGAKGVRDDRGPDFQESKNIIKKLPVWISRIIVPVMSWLVNKRGMHFPGVGFPQDPFGTVIVTSVGMFGVETAFAPLPSIGRANAALLITEVKKKPWVEDDNIVVRPVMKLCCTLDHRVFTGYQGAMLSSEIKDILTNPKRLLET